MLTRRTVFQRLHKSYANIQQRRGIVTSGRMAPPKHFDCAIIGSGQSGTPLASAFQKIGKKTVLIEKAHIGGCCVNEGCTPTKTMVASGRVAYLARRAADYGISSKGASEGEIAVDMKKVRQRKRDIVDSFRSGGETRVAGAGVEIVRGEASFTDPKILKVRLDDGSESTLSADAIFINTGERPVEPQLDGLKDVPPELVLNSTSVQELGEVPSHLLVLGGGYIGLEFGQLFSRLGAKVTIVQRASQLLPREDPEIAAAMLKILQEDGIIVHLSTSATKVAAPSANSVALTIQTKDGAAESISGSHLLFAAGRTPNSDMLNLAAAGISTDKRGYVESNEKLETSVPGIYVLGDVKGPPAFTHISYDDFRILKANLIDKVSPPLSTANRTVPYVVYTDPQLGHVGLHEREARAQDPGRPIQTAQMPMSYVARALETDETRGMMKAVVDAQTGLILGFTCLGLEGGEVMTVIQVAMMGKLRWDQLESCVFSHPSLSESLNNLWGFLK